MHDARAFEGAGLPCSAVVSSGFIAQARYQAKILDAENIPQVFVRHPISDQTRQQMSDKAENTFDDIRTAIMHPWSSSSIASMAAAPVSTDECST